MPLAIIHNEDINNINLQRERDLSDSNSRLREWLNNSIHDRNSRSSSNSNDNSNILSATIIIIIIYVPIFIR